MDDLLIVRLSDRSRTRYTHRRPPVAVGANLLLILGAACGVMFAPSSEALPICIALGVATGIAIGGVLGRLARPRSRPERQRKPDLYDGLPFANTDEAAELDSKES